MRILINYADSVYHQAQRLNSWTGKHIAHFDEVYECGPQDIDETFRSEHQDIFSYKRGNGLWLWKSYLLDKIISESNDGDYIYYIDSGAFFIRNPKIIERYITSENPIFVTDIPLIESNWTKPKCFDLMGGEKFKSTNQIQGGIIIFEINQFTRKFFRKYFEISRSTDLLIPEGLKKNEKPKRDFGDTLVSHREDQSILSLLCKINGIKAHRDITQRWKQEFSFYNPNYRFKPVSHPDDNYLTILYLHKMPNFSFRNLISIITSNIRYKFLREPAAKKDFNAKKKIQD